MPFLTEISKVSVKKRHRGCISFFSKKIQKHYLKHLNYATERENELNKTEFVSFWADVYALFDKIDKNGDGEIDLLECTELLDERHSYITNIQYSLENNSNS